MQSTTRQASQEAPGVVLSVARYWRMSLLIVVLAVATTYGVSLLLPERYVAISKIGITDARGGIFNRTGTFPADLERYTARQTDQIESKAVFDGIREVVGNRPSRELFRDLDAEAGVPGVVQIEASGKTPEEAQELANAVPQAYATVVGQRTRSEAATAVESINSTRLEVLDGIEETEDELADDTNNAVLENQLSAAVTTLDALNQRINEITINADAFGDGVDYVKEARLPTAPAEPEPLRNAGVAGLLGLLVAGVVAWIRADRHQAADEEAIPAEILGAPMLGSVPEVNSDLDLAGVSDPRSAAAEAYQFVTASLQYLFESGVVLVTSAGRRDGKTVSAASMAAAAARDGTRVVLVDADARSHGLTRRLLGAAGDRARGLVDIAGGTASRDEVVRLLALSDHLLPFVPAGGDVASQGSLFRSQGMGDAIASLREEYELVVVDCAAILAVADVSSLASHADGIVVVVSRGTPIKFLEGVRQRLELVPAPLVGYLFTRTEPDEPASSYGTGYQVPWHLVPRRRGVRRARRTTASAPFDGNASRPNAEREDTTAKVPDRNGSTARKPRSWSRSSGSR